VKPLAQFFVETAIRSIIFIIPVFFVAQWCDVAPTWKTAAFVMFCFIWNDITSGPKQESVASGDGVARRKPAAAAMTPAQVAAEARKLMRESKPRPRR
jgi:hypothetical protein